MNSTKLKTLLLLHFSKYLKPQISANLSDIEREMNVTPGCPNVRDFLLFLIEEKVLVYYKTILGVNYYYVNRERLKEIIDKQELFKLHIKYLKDVAILWG